MQAETGRRGDDVAGWVEQFRADRDALLRRYDLTVSPARWARLAAFCAEWEGIAGALTPGPRDEELDRALLLRFVARSRAEWAREVERSAAAAFLLPFAGEIVELHESRRRHEVPDARAAAAALDRIAAAARAMAGGAGAPRAETPVHLRAQARRDLEALRGALAAWHSHFSGYDPAFTWWTAAPYRHATAALEAYAASGFGTRTPAAGSPNPETEAVPPLGEEGLRWELAAEGLPYSPLELIAAAETEYAWGEAEMRRAAGELGFGDDWRAALEHVKSLHGPPGSQPALVRDLAREAIAFVEARELVTVPPLAKEVWRLEMMTPAEQEVNPFFLGGEVIKVSYPTDTMSHAARAMSLRGNNPHFSRATVQHELIPGHHLQGFMAARHHPHRRLFSTPFWVEGWTLHWEMLLWELGFPRGPEDRIGMLFWRMHRCMRIVFSFGYHLETMTPDECVECLVERVGHERANAEGEVRRSFAGNYPPLYQAAYLLGGLQVHTLYREATASGRYSAREFHDRVLQSGPMPPPFLRALLLDLPFNEEVTDGWRFLDGA